MTVLPDRVRLRLELDNEVSIEPQDHRSDDILRRKMRVVELVSCFSHLLRPGHVSQPTFDIDM